jgi:dUTP pyrophosphatase
MKIAKVRDVKTPVRGTGKSAGIDFFIPNDFKPVTLSPHYDLLIPSGIKANVPEGYMLMAAEKSGVVTSKQAAVAAGRTPKPTAYTTVVILGAKIVDEDYQGEIHIHLVNVGNEYVTIKPGTKIAQFILVPVSYQGIEVVPEAELFPEATERGEGGFGLGTGEGSKSDIEPLDSNEL